jgi:hypothetical protein
VSVNEYSQSVLVKGQGSERFIGWTFDSQGVLFTSDRSGMNGLWLQGVRDGKAENEPRLVAPIDGSIYASSCTLKGGLYYEVGRLVSDVFLAKLDPEARKLAQAPKKIEKATIGRSSTPFWSADGRQLAYFFRKGLSANHYEYDTLKIIDQETGSTREIPLDFAAQPSFMPLPRWTRDGKYINFRSPKNNIWGLIRLNVKSGQSDMIAAGDGIVAWSTDGSVVFIIDRGSPPQKFSEASLKIIRKNIDSGEQKILYQGGKGEIITGVMLSPNEAFLGFQSIPMGEYVSIARGVGIIPADSKSILAREHIPCFFPLEAAHYDWTYDGKGLIFQVWSKQVNPDQEAPLRYLYYPSIDPTLDPIKLEMNLNKTGTNIAFHPDGKTIAFTGQSHIYEFWVMENFLPKK